MAVAAPLPHVGALPTHPQGPAPLHLLFPIESSPLWSSFCFLDPASSTSHTEAWDSEGLGFKRTLVLLSSPYCIAAYINIAAKICIGTCFQKPGKNSERNSIGSIFVINSFSVWLNWGREGFDHSSKG